MANELFTHSRISNQAFPDCQPQPTCDPRPVCPDCGGLECLCRPRFFAGQLLTEEDLNRLERYVVDKNKLRNRYLHGWGVACGLEVVCAAPCEPDASRGRVVVRPGYALSPCGNDIIVCRQETVDICELIERCRPQLPDECFAPGPNNAVADGPEEWILAVCYDERPSRGITALRGATGAHCGCGNKSCAGGCGCNGGNPAYAPRPAVAPKPVPAQCEPTLTCEGYTFRVFKAPKNHEKPTDHGALTRRMLCCMQPLLAESGQFPPAGTGPQQQLQWYFSLKNTLRDFLVAEGLYDCEAAHQLAIVPDPQLVANGQLTGWDASTWAVVGIASAIIKKCACAALLPPCPEPVLGDCVPLATVTIRRSPCRVTRICNISARKFLLTFPNIAYWLSWIPLFQSSSANAASLRRILERMCCTPIDNSVAELKGNVSLVRTEAPPPIHRPAAAGGAPQAATGSGGFGAMLNDALGGGRPANPAALLVAAMGATRKDGQPLLSDQELAEPVALLMLNQVLAPALRTLLPPATGGQNDAAAMGRQLGELANKVETLTQQLATQQDIINRLKPQ